MASVVSVAVVAQPLIEEDPRTAGDAAIKAILGNTSIVGEIVDNAVYGFSHQFEQYYQEGLRSKYGLPKSRPGGGSDYLELTRILKSIEEGKHANPVDRIVIMFVDVGRQENVDGSMTYLLRASYTVYFDNSGYIPYVEKYGWSYDIGSGTYPTLDVLWANSWEWYSDYMPIVGIRLADENLSADYKADNFEYSKRMLGKLGFRIEDLLDSLNGDEENPNNIENLQDVMVGCFADLDSEEPLVIKYLMNFFEKHLDIYGDDPQDAEYILDLKSQGKDYPNVRMGGGHSFSTGVADVTTTDYVTWKDDLQYSTSVSWEYIERGVKPKVIGKIGTIKRDVVLKDFSRDHIGSWDKSYIEYFEQIDILNCRFVKVVGPTTFTYIDPREFNGSSRYYVEDLLRTENKGKIVLPLNRSLLDEFTVTERNTVYARTFQLVIYAEQWTKLKWYETGTFKLFLTAAAVVISLITLNPQIGALISAASIYVAGQILLQIILTQILTQYVIKKVFSLVVDLLGIDAALVLAAILAVAAGIKGVGLDVLNMLPSASELMFAAQALSKQTSLAIADDAYDVMQEYENLTASYDEKMDKIEEAAAGLSYSLSPLDLVESVKNTLVIESAENFYIRTTDSNPGIKTFMMVENFVDTALTLPTYEGTTIQ